MAKVYIVEGQSDTKPEGLPPGLTVKEQDGPKGGTSTSLYGTTFRVREHTDANHLRLDIKSEPDRYGDRSIDTVKLFSFDEARNLRDHINEVLGDSGYALRTVIDESDDKWFEVCPDNFLYDDTRREAESRWVAGGRKSDYGTSLKDIISGCGIKNIVFE
jgi:hypothetical protein